METKKPINIKEVKKMNGHKLVSEGMKAVKEGRLDMYEFKNLCEVWLEEKEN